MDLALEAHTQRAATIGLAIRDDPTHPCQSQGQTLFNGDRGFHTIAAIAISPSEPQGDAAISTHAETEQHLFEIVPPIFAMVRRLAAVPMVFWVHLHTPHRAQSWWCPDAATESGWRRPPAL